MPDNVNESERIRLAQQGNARALAILLHDHYSFLVKYMVKITMQPDLAEDLVQETMIRCIEKLHLYNGKSKFSSWLITIASRIYIDYLRKGKREREQQEEMAGQLRKLQWESETSDERWPELIDALADLPADIRLPIIMRHYYGYTQDEIAEMLDIPQGTVKSRIHNGLKRLRKEMSSDEA